MFMLVCLCAICFVGKAQTIIQMEKYGGVYRIPCKVNGAKMKLIFDTGADKVCISLAMAEYLLDNDYLSKNDIKGSGSSTVADGSIVDHIKINIRDIEIQGIHLKNVEAVVIEGQNAPLLFGQSAIKRLGKYSISGNKMIIGSANGYSSQPTKSSELTEEELDVLFKEADNAIYNGSYYVALEILKQLYEYDLLSAIGIMRFADCYYYTNQTEEALALYQDVKTEIESEHPDYKVELYFEIGRCFWRMKDYNNALSFLERAKYYSTSYSDFQIQIVRVMASVYADKGDHYNSIQLLDNYIFQYLFNKGLNATDCWNRIYSKATMEDYRILAKMYYELALCSKEDKYMILAAAWGSSDAIEWCKKYNLNYLTKPSKYNY